MLILAAPSKLMTDGSKLTGLQCVRMELGEPDASGRRRPVPIENSEFEIPLDTLLVAIGDEADTTFASAELGIEVSRTGNVVVDSKTGATSVDGVFAGGDATTGPANIIDAMAAGMVAAESIDRYIRGVHLEREVTLPHPSMCVPRIELLPGEKPDRPIPPQLPVAQRIENHGEVESVLAEEAAVLEARRCLRCDLETEEEETSRVEVASVSLDGVQLQ